MTSGEGTPYPAHWEADVVLRDGSTMHIRPIRPDDADALQTFHRGQSAESVYFRFFAPMESLSSRDLARFTTVDHAQRVALVLVKPTEAGRDEILAVGRFDRLEEDGDVAEVAFNVADSVQGRGLGSILLEHLAAAGRELGVRRFVADVLPSNSRMLRVFTDAGYDVTQTYADGIVEVSVPIRPTDRSLDVLAERERRAEALSMTALLAATGVLVLHTGEEGAILGRQVLAAVAAGTFTGDVRSAASHQELETLDGDLPSLAVVAAPPEEVLDVLPRLAERGVRAVVLLTGGFTPSTDGRTSQRALVRTLRGSGLRLAGPRSYGVLAHGEAGPLDATLGPRHPQPGDVGIFCQSSAAARVLLEQASERRIGLSSFLAAGRRVDVSGNDTMQFWTSHDRTRVACLSLESIGNPRKFSRVARRLASSRPVVVTIAGTTGQQQLPGHAVRTSNAPKSVLTQLMRQAGVLLADSIREQLDWAMLLSSQPLPEGDRVLVVSNSGGQTAILEDLVDDHGLTAVPVVLSAAVSGAGYRRALDAAADDGGWDMAVVAYGPFGVNASSDVAAAAAELAATSARPVAAAVLGRTGLHPELTTDTTGQPVRVPGYTDVADAVGALAAARRHAKRLAEREGTRVDPPDIKRRHARSLTRTALLGVPAGTSVRMPPDQAAELLACYGLGVWPATKVTDLESALAAATSIGWPVALKASDEIVRHRSDLGGVRLDLSTPSELTEAFRNVTDRLRALGRQNPTIEVQRMAPAGAACVVTGIEDDLYGPILSFGLAGDAVELLDDVAYRIPPLTDTDVAGLIRAVRASPRLLGYRGLPALDTPALEDVIARASVLKEELPEIRSVVLNPVLVGEHGAAILSATVDLAPAERGDMARRTLP